MKIIAVAANEKRQAKKKANNEKAVMDTRKEAAAAPKFVAKTGVSDRQLLMEMFE